MDPIYKILEGFRPLTEAINLDAYNQKLGGQLFADDNALMIVVPTNLVDQIKPILDAMGFEPYNYAKRFYDHAMDALQNWDGPEDHYWDWVHDQEDVAWEIQHKYGSLEKYVEAELAQRINWIVSDDEPPSLVRRYVQPNAAIQAKWLNQFVHSHAFGIVQELLNDGRRLPQTVVDAFHNIAIDGAYY